MHNVDRVSKAEGLGQLPADYSKLTPAASIPILGPPLPGDLGGPMLRAELGQASSAGRPMGYDEQANVERVARAREAEDAAKAPVIFKQGSHTPLANAQTAAPAEGPERAASRTSNDIVANAGGSGLGAGAPLSSTADRRQAFIDRPNDLATQSARLQPPVSRFLVTAGTVIPAALLTGINSDLPGPVVATVTGAVYDSATGRYLLIPQGSRLVGRYDSQVSFGQRRVLMVWTRLILPDTSSIALDRLQGLDVAGRTGLEDGVDWHWERLLAGAGLSTMMGIGAELAAPQRGGGEGQIVIAMRQSMQETANEVGKELTKRNLDVQPTLTIRSGFELRVMVNKDMVLRPYQPLFFNRGAQ
ncbi:TrbI/VirB10 family protein [Caenimonas soli]|uniref:TrbI/VirB10 family protein n=1 Tax=Caenimonas soli TaxID=2735555 RepID=UPI002E29F0FB|nr:TrbI/VirB10 family protein [Caenimonas soli]